MPGSLHALFHLILTHKTIIRWVGYSGSRTQSHAFELPSHKPPSQIFYRLFEGQEIHKWKGTKRIYENVQNWRLEELGKFVQRVSIWARVIPRFLGGGTAWVNHKGLVMSGRGSKRAAAERQGEEMRLSSWCFPLQVVEVKRKALGWM